MLDAGVQERPDHLRDVAGLAHEGTRLGDWPGSSELPLPLLAAAAAVSGDETTAHPRTPVVRLRTARGDWLSVHASPLHGPAGHSTVLVLEEPGPSDIASLILDCHGVTGA